MGKTSLIARQFLQSGSIHNKPKKGLMKDERKLSRLNALTLLDRFKSSDDLY